MKKKNLVCGVGINDADYTLVLHEYFSVDGEIVRKRVWECPVYQTWRNLLKRCYYQPTLTRQPTYVGCSVCEEWLTFSNFKAWMETQDWEGKQLDKDILFPGNKIYSSHNCVFVSRRTNLFITDSGASRGDFLIGVSLSVNGRKFIAKCRDSSGRLKHLGLFATEIEAHKAWLAFKLEQARILAAEQTDPRIAKALIERYENYAIEE